MMIDEKIEEMQGKLIKAVIEADSRNKEEAVQKLEEFGLAKEFATELLIAYGEAESTKRTAKNVWDSAWKSTSGIDYSTDIAKTQEREFRARRRFDHINSECALIMVANTIEPSEIDEQLLDKLYEKSVQEHHINNPALKITYHYYSQSKQKDNQIAVEKANADRKVSIEHDIAENRIASLSNQLKDLRGRYARLNDRYNTLQSRYESLQNNFKERFATAEKNYQAALSQISALKDKVGKLQNQGIFKTIGDKLTGLFGNKKLELPEKTTNIPDTLYESNAEKMGLRMPGEEELRETYIENNHEKTTQVKQTSKDDWQL